MPKCLPYIFNAFSIRLDWILIKKFAIRMKPNANYPDGIIKALWNSIRMRIRTRIVTIIIGAIVDSLMKIVHRQSGLRFRSNCQLFAYTSRKSSLNIELNGWRYVVNRCDSVTDTNGSDRIGPNRTELNRTAPHDHIVCIAANEIYSNSFHIIETFNNTLQ